jgi:putative ABC transport system permease protein
MSFLLDLRHGLRRLRRRPGFTALATACLGIGIGASVGLFSILHTLVLRPLPGVAAPRELVTLVPKPMPMPGLPGVTLSKSLSYPVYRQYREANRVFSGLAAYERIPVSLAVPGQGNPVRISGHLVTDNYFATLGLESAVGRTLAGGRGAETEVVISRELSQRVFGLRRDVLGRPLLLNGQLFQVAGVLPQGFRGVERTEPVDVWIAMEAAPRVVPGIKPGDLSDPAQQWFPCLFARLMPGANRSKAEAEIDVISRMIAKGGIEAPGFDISEGLGINPYLRKRIFDSLLVVTGVISLLMLLVCANLAGLLLIQAAAREREIGIRVAFGATQGRIVRQLLSESLLLGLLGGLAGVAIGRGLMRVLEGMVLDGLLPQLAGLSLDRQALTFALTLALAAGVLFGFAPALWLSSEARWIREGSGTTPGRSRLQDVLVVGQVALSLMLLVGTGLFVRTWHNLQEVPPGLDGRGVVDLQIDLELQRYGEAPGQAFYDQLLDRVRRIPGVRSASLAVAVPLASHQEIALFSEIQVPGQPLDGKAGPRMTAENLVSPGYFATLGIPLVSGRDFSARDREGAPPVVIVSRSFARSIWGTRDPVGERITIDSLPMEVVGVAADVLTSLRGGPRELLYRPLHQFYFPNLTLHVKTAGGEATARAVVSPIRAEMARLDRTVPIAGVSLLEEEIRQASAQPRLFSQLLGGTSGVALLLTGIGLYGSLVLAVRRRTRELGIRRALGAQTSEVLALVLRQGLGLTAVGLTLGIAASLLATRALSGMLFGVTPTDPAVFATVALICGSLGAAASLLPAWSAARVDPMEALRQEG